MRKFSSQEIESQYNLIRILLAEPEKFRDAINIIKKDIAYMPIKLKKTWGRKYYLINQMQTVYIFNFYKLVSSYSCKLT